MYQRVIVGYPALSGGKSIRRWVLLIAALTLTLAVAVVPGAPAQAESHCGNSALAADCQTLLSLMDTLRGTANLNWSNTTPIADWEGITRGGSPERVTGIDLSSKSLTGTIPSELGNLSSLASLILRNNQLTGSIPSELGDLSTLTHLYLSSNRLTGTIPVELGDLSTLTHLYLSSNQLTGSIPAELGDLSSLTDLYLGSNRLTGSIPDELGSLNNLARLSLTINELTGSIPTGLGGLSSLTVLSLGSNRLTGSIPDELGDLSSLRSLSLNNNELTGSIPDELGDLSSLTTLHLDDNHLTGSIPPQLGNLSSLTNLWLSKNQLTGSIPADLGGLSSLTHLLLSNNQLTGSIAPKLGNLSSLTNLWLNSNQLTGSIPPELGNLSSLSNLLLSYNQLTGSIPVELGNLSSLNHLRLNSNQLTGSIPVELGNLSSLTLLGLTGNQLTGSIPAELSNLSNLTHLYLADNELDSEIPVGLNLLAGLKYVRLQDNFDLTGPAHLNFIALTTAYLGYLEQETWAVADFSSANNWTLSGTDSNEFEISSDGVLRFKSPPDFDTHPTNSYSMQVAASAVGTEKTADISVFVMDRDIALSVSPGSMKEEDSATDFTVTATMDETLPDETSVILSLSGTAIGEGTDYTGGALPTITIPADSLSATTTLTLTPADDAIKEGNEVVEVVGVSGTLAVSSARITIQETQTLSLSGPDGEVDEGSDASFKVTLSLAVADDVTVEWSVTPDSASSASPADYGEASSGSVTFAAGSAATEKSFKILVKDDYLSEGAESFSVSLGTITSDISDQARLDLTASSVVVTIAKSDPIIVSLAGPDSVAEGEAANYTVNFSPEEVTPSADFTVAWSVTPDSASPADYGEASSGSVTFAAGSAATEKSFDILVKDDDLPEGEESFTVSLVDVMNDISGQVTVNQEASSVDVTIRKSDPIVTLSGPDSVAEGEAANYTVSLSPKGFPPTEDLIVDYATAAGSAGSDDYEEASGTLTFTSGAAGDQTFTVQTTEDSLVEGDETFSIVLIELNGGGEPPPSFGSPSSLSVTITDDDRRSSPGNRWPEFDEGVSAARTIAENSEMGTAIGEPVRARDLNYDPLEYWLWGTDEASFDVNPTTGQLSSKTALDREVKNEYSVRMRVRDGRGGFDEIRVTIIVENVDEPPARPAAPAINDCSYVALVVSWSTPDNQGPEITGYDVRYREEGGAFQASGYDGNGTSSTLENLRPETAYEVQVRAINAEGTGAWSESGRCVTKAGQPADTPSDNTKPNNTPTPTPEPTATPEPPATPEPTTTPEPAATHNVTTTLNPISPAVPVPLFASRPTPEPALIPPAAASATAEPIPLLPTGDPVPTPDDILPPAPPVEPVLSTTAEPDGGFPWWVLLAGILGAIGGSAALIWRSRQHGPDRSLRRAGSPSRTVIGKVSNVVRGWARNLTGSIRTVARIARRDG